MHNAYIAIHVPVRRIMPNHGGGLTMPPKKTAMLSLRIDPSLKEAVRIAASKEHRSVANMVEVMIRDYCEQSGISIPEQQTLFQDGETDE